MFEWALSTLLLPLYEIRSPNTCSETIETFWVFDSVSLLSFVALFDGFKPPTGNTLANHVTGSLLAEEDLVRS